MPELPEVETLRRQLSRAIVGRVIKAAKTDWPKMVRPLSTPAFQKQIKNQKIVAVKRRAKVLILDLAGPLSLLIHLKLTGQLIFQPVTGQLSGGQPTEKNLRHKKLADRAVIGGHPQKNGSQNLPNKFTHLTFEFQDGAKLFFNDLRKFGWARLVDDQGVAKMVESHGPEPLAKDFTAEYLTKIFKKYPRRKIKQILLDQKLIGGVGNIYTDESCFCANILPTRLAGKIKPAETEKLLACLVKVIKLAIAKGGTSADTYIQLDGRPGGFLPYLKVYGRRGQPCRRCGAKKNNKKTAGKSGQAARVQYMKINGRGTHFCPQCQK